LRKQLLLGVGALAVAGAAMAASIRDDAPMPPQRGQNAQEQYEINVTYAALMTGPKATPPKWKAVKRVMAQQKMGLSMLGKRVKIGANIFHPTKGLRTI
jgi:hypothetical protein